MSSATRFHIFFLIGSLEIGGSETQLVELASRLDRASFDVTVCSMTTSGPLGQVLAERGVRVVSLGITGLRNQTSWRALARGVLSGCRGLVRLWVLLVRSRPDVLHGILIDAYLTAAFVGRSAGIRRIVASRRSLGIFKERRRFALALERLADRCTDLFVANSDAVRKDTLTREPIDPRRITVIRNGLDFSRFDIRRGEPRAGSGQRVIVVSNLIHYKGHEFFFRAWKDVLVVFPHAEAIVVGEGPHRRVLETLVSDLGITKSVQFLGRRMDVPELLAAADVYVHPSLQEGYSNALLEAMAASVPIVATAVGGNVEALDDGVTGVLVSPADPAALAAGLRRLLSNPDAARQMATRARAAVRARHDVTGMVQAYEEQYRRLVGRDGARPRLGNMRVNH